MELSTMITGAQQQRNATATQFDSSDFFVRRPEEYEGNLTVLTARIEESYTQEINLRGYLHQLLGILNELQCHFQGTAEESERDMDWFEESATQPIVTITIKERRSLKTTVPCKFPTVLGHLLTVVSSELENNRMR